jgi:hypothetical protein
MKGRRASGRSQTGDPKGSYNWSRDPPAVSSGKPQAVAVKNQNKALAERYSVEGFPTVLLLDATGKVVGRTGYKKGGPSAYVEHIKQLNK